MLIQMAGNEQNEKTRVEVKNRVRESGTLTRAARREKRFETIKLKRAEMDSKREKIAVKVFVGRRNALQLITKQKHKSMDGFDGLIAELPRKQRNQIRQIRETT